MESYKRTEQHRQNARRIALEKGYGKHPNSLKNLKRFWSEKDKQRQSSIIKARYSSGKYIARKGIIPWNKNKPWSEEVKQKISKSLIGRKIWCEGKKLGPHSAEHNIKIGLSGKGRIGYWRGKKLTSEQIKKRLRRNAKSSLEIKFENIVNQLGLPYKFVGNGEVIIARKCPDFVNSNGEKVAVEVFYRKHKELFRGGLSEWKAERARIFSENGWKIIFFDETEVNEEMVRKHLEES